MSIPENILDILATEAMDGIAARLQLMTLAPKTICVMGHRHDLLSEKLRQRFPEVVISDDQPDLVIANFYLPWQQDMHAVLKAWSHQLSSQGLLMFTAFGPDTLREWPDQNECLVNRIDMHDIGDAMVQAGLADPVLEVEHTTLVYRDYNKMLDELTAAKLLKVLATPADKQIQKWQLTIETVFGHAWKSEPKQRSNDAGETSIPISMLRAQLRGR